MNSIPAVTTGFLFQKVIEFLELVYYKLITFCEGVKHWNCSVRLPGNSMSFFLTLLVNWYYLRYLKFVWEKPTINDAEVSYLISLDVEVGLVEGEDYQALTDKEEKDLEQLMTQCGSAVSNAEAFMETLARDLSILDGVSCVREWKFIWLESSIQIITNFKYIRYSV